jgi:putative transposase
MRTSKFTNEQIVQALRQAESGTPVVDICRKLGVSEQTFYRWKKKFMGLDVSDVRELKQLRDENRKLKSLVAELSLDKTILREALRKKWRSGSGLAPCAAARHCALSLYHASIWPRDWGALRYPLLAREPDCKQIRVCTRTAQDLTLQRPANHPRCSPLS